jgi:hypothetical protein
MELSRRPGFEWIDDRLHRRIGEILPLIRSDRHAAGRQANEQTCTQQPMDRPHVRNPFEWMLDPRRIDRTPEVDRVREVSMGRVASNPGELQRTQVASRSARLQTDTLLY